MRDESERDGEGPPTAAELVGRSECCSEPFARNAHPQRAHANVRKPHLAASARIQVRVVEDACLLQYSTLLDAVKGGVLGCVNGHIRGWVGRQIVSEGSSQPESRPCY